jgi:hypothetical protein
MVARVAAKLMHSLAAAVGNKVGKEAEELCALGQCAAAAVALKLAVDLGHLPSRALKEWMLLDGRDFRSLNCRSCLNADIVIGAEWANSAEPVQLRRMYMLSRNEMWTKKFGAGCCSSSNYNGCHHHGFAFVPPVSSDLISHANRLALEMTP